MHPGLTLDKPAAKDWWQGDDTQYVRTRLIAACAAPGDPNLLASLRKRRESALPDAARFSGETAGPLSLHLARASAFENAGICLHPLYGFAYIPGSGLKGMARAFAELSDEARELIDEVFGPPVTRDSDARAGAVVFHDAWPTSWPKLAVDIVNCHHAEYYRDRKPPEDWENPIPVNFLHVVPGTQFEFAVSPRAARSERNAELVQLAASWLRSALVHLGAGAKTNAGYGRFKIEGSIKPLPGRASFEAILTLTSPAFLAGARPEIAADCGLRPASVRGLLRWWWRTLHAGHLAIPALREWEGRIWGTTAQAGAIALEIIPLQQTRPVAFDKAFIARQHRLPSPRSQKQTQGLNYLSFGMDEKKLRRYYLPEGASWKIRLTAKAAHGLDGSQVLQQALAALWIFSESGNIGAKSRRGFGSFSLSEPSQSLPSTRDEALNLVSGLPGRKAALDVEALASPSASYMLVKSVPLGTSNVWVALDRLGFALQAFGQQYKHQEIKRALGLPRSIHKGPERKPLSHPSTVGRHPRHASPLHLRVVPGKNGLVAKLVAFPSVHLPDREESARVLKLAIAKIQEELKVYG